MKKSGFWKNYGFLILMLTGIVAGCVVGAIWPAVKDASGEVIVKGATVLEPLGTVFLNLMFCIAVPTVFCSISSSIANMQSAKRAGKIMGVTIATFLTTAAIAAVIMYVTVLLIPPVTGEYAMIEGEVGGTLGVADMIVNFFTKPDFTELFSRRAILPLIVAAVLFGFGVQMAGGAQTKTAQLLDDITNCIMKTFKIITYYAPIGFFGFFAYLIAYHGSDLIGDYGRALAIYYILSFVYMLVSSPIYARFGGGKGAAKVMFSKLFRPAAMSFGTCSSVATIPTNMEVAKETGISKDVSNIVVPLGATMHMDGSAMSAIIKVAFLFGMFGQDFTTGTRHPRHHRGGVFLGRHVRHPGRRRHGRAGFVLHLLPGPSGGRLPHRARARQSRRSPRDHGQLRGRLRRLLHRLALRRRQGLAAEAAGKKSGSGRLRSQIKTHIFRRCALLSGTPAFASVDT